MCPPLTLDLSQISIKTLRFRSPPDQNDSVVSPVFHSSGDSAAFAFDLGNDHDGEGGNEDEDDNYDDYDEGGDEEDEDGDSVVPLLHMLSSGNDEDEGDEDDDHCLHCYVVRSIQHFRIVQCAPS